MNAPDPVRHLVEGWRASDHPTQASIPWPRRRWVDCFPAHAGLFEGLPERLDRTTVRSACAAASTSSEHAVDAFLVAMAWGYGRVGYGCWRTRRVLDQPGAGNKLADAAGRLFDQGAAAAYEGLSTTGRLHGLGPAFGTKFLYFCPPPADKPQALILDRVVSGWIRDSLGILLDPVPWSGRTYLRYLDLLGGWADDLKVSPDTIEEQIFVSSASGQWAKGSA